MDGQDETRPGGKRRPPVRFLRGRPDGIPWERGRPARIPSLWAPLSFRAMPKAANLSAGAASAMPTESRRRRSGLIQVGGFAPGCARFWAGGTPALPGEG